MKQQRELVRAELEELLTSLLHRGLIEQRDNGYVLTSDGYLLAEMVGLTSHEYNTNE